MAMGGVMAQDKTTNDEQSKRFEFSLHLGLRNMPVGYLAEEQIMKLDGYMPMRYKPGSRYSGGALRGLHFNFGMKLKYNLPSYEGWGIIATLDYFAIANATDNPVCRRKRLRLLRSSSARCRMSAFAFSKKPSGVRKGVRLPIALKSKSFSIMAQLFIIYSFIFSLAKW